MPDTFPQLIRTAFIPSPGNRFIVADFSAIEACVIAWLAGEASTLAAFEQGKDLHRETASRIFGVPVKKHGISAELRQKGKIATLAYVKPQLGENRWGGTSITYTGTTTARRWGQLETYGGNLVETIVQAVARDLLVVGMHAVAQAGHRIVMHVHDEIVIDEPQDSGFTVDDACQLMSTLPDWAEDLPLDADGYECDYYRKD